MALTEKLTAIADAIREKTGKTDTMTLDEMPAEINDVYDAGKQAEYDTFWDAYQDYGKRTIYRYAFMRGFNDSTFYPKYDLKPGQYSQYMFWTCQVSDLAARLKECSVTLDTSSCDDLFTFFGGATTKSIPVISTVSANSLVGIFTNSQVKTIEKLILRQDGTQTFSNVFEGCRSLVDLTVEGVIGNGGFYMHQCSVLSKASIISVVNALSSTTSGLTITFSLTAVNNAFETAAGSADGSASEAWDNLVATKSNWTISLL